MISLVRTRSWVVAACLVAACTTDQGPMPPEAIETTPASMLARGLAIALSDESLRGELRDVLRASRLVEHKVELQSFMDEPSGQKLVAAAARGLGMGSRELGELIATLPPLQLYMPRREDRLTWRATADVVVGITLDNDKLPSEMWTLAGTWRTMDTATPNAFLLLEPSEAASLRVHPQPDRAGDVIQDADDGEFGGRVILYDRNGARRAELQLYHLVRRARLTGGRGIAFDCEDPQAIDYCDDGGGGGGGGSPASDTTILHHFSTNGGIGDGIGGNEVVFRTVAYNASGGEVTRRDLEIHNCPWRSTDGCSTPALPLIFVRILDNTTAQFNVEVFEDDQFNNDEYGNRFFTWEDNGQARAMSGGGHTSTITVRWTPRQ